MTENIPKEGFAVETIDGLIFTVKGLVHPCDRVIAYLRYLPDENGNRIRNDVRYRRVYQFAEQQAILEKRFPHYLGNDPCLNISVQMVARDRIKKIYDPCQALGQICKKSGKDCDQLEGQALAFAEIIQKEADIPLSSLGISGSVMLGLNLSSSDLDFIVYGREQCCRVYAALGRLLEQGHQSGSLFKRLDTTEMARLHSSHRPDTPIPFDEFKRLQNRKVNEGLFNEIPYFIRFVPDHFENLEQYDDVRFEPLGQALIKARIVDGKDRIFTPCRYRVEKVECLEGECQDDIFEIVSFRGRFSDQGRKTEMARARGSLERVIPKAAPSYCRLIIGGSPGDYLMTSPFEEKTS
jgi:hypothetical protein